MVPWARRRSVGSGQVHGSVRQLGEAAHASRGVGAPEGPEVELWALTFSPPGSRHPTGKLARLPRFVRLRVQNPTGLAERQHKALRMRIGACSLYWWDVGGGEPGGMSRRQGLTDSVACIVALCLSCFSALVLFSATASVLQYHPQARLEMVVAVKSIVWTGVAWFW